MTGYVFRDNAKHVLGAASRLDYLVAQRRFLRGWTAGVALFSGFSLLDRLRYCGVLPAWKDAHAAKRLGPPVETPGARQPMDLDDGVDLRPGGKTRLRLAASAIPILAIVAVMMELARSAEPIARFILAAFAVLPVYVCLVVLFFAIYPLPVARVSQQGLWLIETGWIPWHTIGLLRLKVSRLGATVTVHLKPGFRGPRTPLWARPLRWLQPQRRFASIGARDLGLDAEVWMRYANRCHGVSVTPESLLQQGHEHEGR